MIIYAKYMQCIFYMQQVFQQQINYNLHQKIYNQGSGPTFALAQQPKGCLIKTHLQYQSGSFSTITSGKPCFISNRCHQGTSAQEIFPTGVGSQNFGSHYQCPLAVFVLDNVEDGSHVSGGQIAVIEAGADPCRIETTPLIVVQL